MSGGIESVLSDTRIFPPSPEFVKNANVSGMAAYKALCDEAERDFEGFWARLAREHLLWRKPFTKTLDESKAPFFKWFYDGELRGERKRGRIGFALGPTTTTANDYDSKRRHSSP